MPYFYVSLLVLLCSSTLLLLIANLTQRDWYSNLDESILIWKRTGKQNSVFVQSSVFQISSIPVTTRMFWIANFYIMPCNFKFLPMSGNTCQTSLPQIRPAVKRPNLTVNLLCVYYDSGSCKNICHNHTFILIIMYIVVVF